MRKFYFLPIFLLLSSSIYAQDWFPSDASWYYHQVIGSGNSFQHLEVLGDTILQGKNCKVIRGVCQCSYYGDENILYQEESQIYIFSHQADSFKLLYDFSLLPGDTLVYRGDEEVEGDGYFLIDSITVLHVGTLDLRVQHITWLDGYLQYGTKIIERIGANGCLYPVIWICDPGTAGLRCYEDSETGLLNFQIPEVPCEFVSSVESASKEHKLNIYPNPTTGIFWIESALVIRNIELYNNLAELSYQNSSVDKLYAEIEIESFPSGLYYLKVTTKDNLVLFKPIVLQK